MRNEVTHPALGTPAQPGEFTLTAFHLARRVEGGIEPLFAPPADLVSNEEEGRDFPHAVYLRPATLAEGIKTSFLLPQVPVLAQKAREKPVSGHWLTASGWQAVLRGELPNGQTHWIKSDKLWRMDERVGIGMNATRSVNEGQLFTTQAIAFKPDVGFLAQVAGVDTVPETGLVRLGGDGRAVALHPASVTLPEPDYGALLAARRLRLILTTPGLFAKGWLPTGASGDTTAAKGVPFELHGVRAALIAVAVPRAEVVSGWDLANRQPKIAERAAPAGSVYWLDQVEASETALRKLVAEGLWQTPDENASRRAEGFNRCTLARWNEV
jgi:CRISPR-associated protein Cmr3